MKAFGRGFLSFCAALLLVVSCGSIAWADEGGKDVSQMEIFVDGVTGAEGSEVAYEGHPVEPVILVGLPLTDEQLEVIEMPAGAVGADVYDYDLPTIDGSKAHVIEVVPFNSEGICLTEFFFADFDPAESAGVFLARMERDYGVNFLEGSIDRGSIYAKIDMRVSHLDRQTFASALEESTSRLEILPTEGKDYTVSYSHNDKPGMATATVTGVGEYAGTQTVEFRIVDEGAAASDSESTADEVAASASAANAILGYVLLGFLVVAVAVIVIVLWRGAKTKDAEDLSE